MSIKLLEHDKPDLPICVMSCDNGLADHLNEYELTKFLNKHQISLFVGRPASGKTSLLYSLFKNKQGQGKILRGVYSRVYLFQPSNSGASMKDNIFSLIPENQKFNELSFEALHMLTQVIKEDSKNGFTSCIILDDQSAYLKNKETMKLFKELLFNKRHYKLSMFFLVQTWFSVPKDLRRVFDNIFCFKVSKNELTNIFEEVVEGQKDNVEKISKFVFDKPYQFLFINPDSRRLFKCFDELIIATPDNF
jgi:hypothetical protein